MTNTIAGGVALELLLLDKGRAVRGEAPAGAEHLIATGAECYQRLLASLHGATNDDPDDECQRWMQKAQALRSVGSGIERPRWLGGGAAEVSDEDVALLDRGHPERSFSGRRSAAAGAASATVGPREADLVGALERLRALHGAGALTGDEFAAAKRRLLGQG